MKWRIIVTWSIVRVFMNSLKKFETTEALEKFKCLYLNIILMTLFLTDALFLLVV